MYQSSSKPLSLRFSQLGDILWLLKWLYGLKQSVQMWNKKLHSALQEIRFTHVWSDSSFHVYEHYDVRIYKLIYVDNITIVSHSQAAINGVVKDLEKHFKLQPWSNTFSPGN